MNGPTIDPARTAMIFNDMINSNIRPNPERAKKVESSGLIATCVRWVAELRALGIPIYWIRIERRADGKDRKAVVTDTQLRAGVPRPPVVKGSFEAQNIAELPILPEDQEILKPRFSPFANTDLDLRLRARGIETVLLGGISTNMGVESSARDAFDLDYNVVVLSDCCWAADSDVHAWALTRSLPNFARVMQTAEARALVAGAAPR